MWKVVAKRSSMTSRFLSSPAALLGSFEQTLSVLRKHPGGLVVVLAVFFFLYWTRSFGEAVLGGVVTLAVVARIEGRLFFLWALISITLLPIFYLLDRPAQAERVGVVAFCLLGLGILVNAIDTWRARADY